MLKVSLGITLIFLGILVGAYLGIWWAFIGGIVQIVTAIKASELSGLQIGFGVLRIILASAIGGVSGMCLALPGVRLLK